MRNPLDVVQGGDGVVMHVSLSIKNLGVVLRLHHRLCVMASLPRVLSFRTSAY